MPFARANGITMSYDVEGQGEALVLVSGFGGGMETWALQVSELKRHFQVIRFDNRGIGNTDAPEGPYCMLSMAEDVIGLLDHLGIYRANILGISMGGMIAQEVAINHPSRVRRLVLASTFACRDERSGLTPAYEAEIVRCGYVSEKELYAFAFNNRWVGMLARMLASKPAETGSKAGRAGQLSAIMNHDTLDRLSSIQAPTLVIAGTEDRLIRPSSSEVIAALIPGAKLVWIERGSHAVNVEKRNDFNTAVLSFLYHDRVTISFEAARQRFLVESGR